MMDNIVVREGNALRDLSLKDPLWLAAATFVGKLAANRLPPGTKYVDSQCSASRAGFHHHKFQDFRAADGSWLLLESFLFIL